MDLLHLRENLRRNRIHAESSGSVACKDEKHKLQHCRAQITCTCVCQQDRKQQTDRCPEKKEKNEFERKRRNNRGSV